MISSEIGKEVIKKELPLIPKLPGVYRMLNNKNEILYKSKKKSAKKFLRKVKSSIAMHNTSTQFADGGEFGFGGEVGISTNKIPPSGPVGLNQLISYKYEVLGKGQIRK